MAQEKIKQEEKQEEVYMDFEGEGKKGLPKILIEEEFYNGLTKKIEIVKMPAFGKPDEIGTKLIWAIVIDTEGQPELPMFVRPVILKASKGGGYSNSKLYDVLESCGLLQDAKDHQEELKTIDGLSLFLSQRFVNKPIRVEVKTVNKADKKIAYSKVADIKKFIS